MIVVFVGCNLKAQQKDTVYSNDRNLPSGFIGLSPKGDSIFRSVQTEAEFPGGPTGWRTYLTRNLNTTIASTIPIPAGKRNGKLTLTVKFLVNKDGKISDVSVENADSFPKIFVKEAIRVISEGPNWVPAWQDGHAAFYWTHQNITWINQPN